MREDGQQPRLRAPRPEKAQSVFGAEVEEGMTKHHRAQSRRTTLLREGGQVASAPEAEERGRGRLEKPRALVRGDGQQQCLRAPRPEKAQPTWET